MNDYSPPLGEFQPPDLELPDCDEDDSLTSFEARIKAIPAGMLSCDALGGPVDEYIPRWRAMQVAEEYDTAAYAEGRKDEREELTRLLAWAYGKLHLSSFSRLEDDLTLDEIKLVLMGAQ